MTLFNSWESGGAVSPPTGAGQSPAWGPGGSIQKLQGSGVLQYLNEAKKHPCALYRPIFTTSQIGLSCLIMANLHCSKFYKDFLANILKKALKELKSKQN